MISSRVDGATPRLRPERVVALCGGVGGAKLALGLQAVLQPGCLTLGVNTGDDFTHLGLSISPDLDTVLYTLAGLSDQARGWGRADETWNFMAALKELGGDAWFALGDRDLALHVERTRRLHSGESLTAIMRDLAHRTGMRADLLPMTDAAVRTIVHTDDGPLPFQEYFVKHACKPAVRRIEFTGAAAARPNPFLLDALADRELAAIVICPSNPYLSIDPVLAVPGMREALRNANAPIVVVSPIIGGVAVKGPTAKIMAELGIEVTSRSIADHYRDLIDGLVIDHSDAAQASALAVPVDVTRTLMQSMQDKQALAHSVLDFAHALASVDACSAQLVGSRR